MVRMVYFSSTTVNFFVYMLGYSEFRNAFVKQFKKAKRLCMSKRPNGQRSFGSLSQGGSQSITGHAIELSCQAENTSGARKDGPVGDVFAIRL